MHCHPALFALAIHSIHSNKTIHSINSKKAIHSNKAIHSIHSNKAIHSMKSKHAWLAAAKPGSHLNLCSFWAARCESSARCGFFISTFCFTLSAVPLRKTKPKNKSIQGHSRACLTRDDHIKVLQPVLVPVTANTASEQEVHDHMGVVPQGVGGHKQLLASCPVHVHDAYQARVLMDVLGRVFRHCLLQTAVSVAQIYCCSHIPAPGQ